MVSAFSDFWQSISVCIGGFNARSSQKSIRKRFFPDNVSAKVHCSSLKKIVCVVVSITAPRFRQTLLEIKKGVRESTMAILIQNRSTGTRMARLQGTMLLFPNLNDMLTLRSWINGRIAAGALQRNSSSWWRPMTVWEAPKSTMPVVRDVANMAVSDVALTSWKTLDLMVIGTPPGLQKLCFTLLSTAPSFGEGVAHDDSREGFL